MSAPPPVRMARHGDHVALVTIERPEARNAINAAVAAELARIVAATEADAQVRAVVLTGAGGKVFSAGADLKEVAAGNVAALSVGEGGFAGFVHAARTKPWIAAVEGLALAGGFEIALACDLIVASEDGAFGLPEVQRGLIAAAGGLYRLPQALPRAVALEMILTGERLPAARAAALGLVNRLAPAGTVDARALELAAAICANAPLAVRESLAVARAATARDDAALRRQSEAAQDRLIGTKDLTEGSRAFVEKRAPRWTGR